MYRLSIKILWGQQLGGSPIVWSVSGFLIYLIPITSVVRDCANKEYLHETKPAHLGVLDGKVYWKQWMRLGEHIIDFRGVQHRTVNSTGIMICVAKVSLTWMCINWMFWVYWANHSSCEIGSRVFTGDQGSAWALLGYYFRPIWGHK